ncbi:MAG: sugar ABC transporter permease [Bacillales bacterium]|jgi:multiple sugar transport system permease protein|nr:sugar ABC transporter permease [Bacillales bacterium]
MTKKQKKETFYGWLFVSPQLIGLIAFVIFPLLFSFYLMFAQWNFIDAPVFVGLDNFKFIFRDTVFKKSILNTFIYLITIVPLTVLTSLSLAILTNRKMKFLKFYRAAFFLPMVTSTVAIAMVWFFIYEPNGGIINSLLFSLGMNDPPGWLIDTKFARIAIVIVIVWLKMGYYYIIFDAGLKDIPKELYEAAEIDGASPLQRIFKITIPLLSSVAFFIVVMLFIDIFNIFNEVYIMTGGGPDYSTYTLSMYIHFQAFSEFDMGRASVASWVLFALVGTVTAIQFFVKRRMKVE